MQLYSSVTSPYSRKARILLREKGIACEEITLTNLGGALVEHNPLGKIPALVLDDGTDLFDSVVICEYLDGNWPSPRLIPEAPLARAIVRRWEALADGIADATVAAMLETRRAEALRDPAVIERQHGKVLAALDRAEKDLGDRAYCTGDTFTFADVALVSGVGYLNLRFPSLWKGRCPKVESLLARLHERPSVRDTAPPT
ncbi:MAG: glutathione S-transferase N-terminal domain-containing protein [Polyangiaceae bacterium]